MSGVAGRIRTAIVRAGFSAHYRLTDLAYAADIVTPKRTVAGPYWSSELTNAHGDDPGLAALETLPADAVIVDVGSHVGEYAIPLARGTDRRVVAFEPNETARTRLERNVARNAVDEQVAVHRIGIGDRDGAVPFHRSTFSKLSSFDREHACRWGARVVASERVPIRRLDTLVGEGIPSPDGMKIDVEGAEAAVLRGGAATIEAHHPLLVVEIHDECDGEWITDWLTERDYAIEASDDALICR